MQKFTCEVTNKKGMHARAAAQIVSLVCKYDAVAELSHGRKSAPADSLIKLLTLNAPKGSKVEISINGKEAEALSEALKTLFAQGFGE